MEGAPITTSKSRGEILLQFSATQPKKKEKKEKEKPQKTKPIKGSKGKGKIVDEDPEGEFPKASFITGDKMTSSKLNDVKKRVTAFVSEQGQSLTPFKAREERE